MRRIVVRALIGGLLVLSGCAGTPTAAPSPSPSASPSPTVSPSIVPSPSKKPGKKPKLVSSTGSKGVALTFDDGPHPDWTPKILDSLRRRGVTATFCVIGKLAAKYPKLIERIAREGHTLCNHSWNHEFKLGTWSEAKIKANMSRTNDAIRAAVPDAVIPYFRHPGGNWTPRAMRVAAELEMQSLHWSVDPWDWNRPGTSAIANRVINNTRAGGVVLLHDGGGDRAQTLAALPNIISALRTKYRLIPMPLPAPIAP